MLDGLVQIVVAYERYGLHILSVVDYRDDLKFADTSGDFYFDVAAFTGETSELTLTAIDPNSEVISVMQFDEAPTGIITYPELRWDNTVTEAIIKLPFDATIGELRAGLLRFGFMGQSYAPINSDLTFQVKISSSDAFTFPFNQGSTIKEIQLTRNGSAIVETVELQTSDVYTNAPLPSSNSPLYIGLKDSIDRDALLANALLFNIKDDPTDTAEDAEVYDASGTLIIGKSQNAYSIENLAGKSLTITKMLQNPSIESIERLGYIAGWALDGISSIEEGDYAYAGGTLTNEQHEMVRCLLTFDGIHAIRGQGAEVLEITNSDEIYEGSVFGEASIPQALQTLALVKVKIIEHSGILALKPLFAPDNVEIIPLRDAQSQDITPGYSGNIYMSEV